MNDDDLSDLLSAVRDLMRPHLERSAPLRRIVHHVGELLIEEARRSRASNESDPEGSPPAVSETSLTDQSQQTNVSAAASARECEQPEPEIYVAAELPLNVGGASVRVPVRGTAAEIARAHSALQAEAASDSEEGRGHEASIDQDEIDLALIEKGCRLKAESCRLYIDRRAAEGDPLSEPPLLGRMNEMIAQAKALPKCFLWVFWRDRTQPDDATLKMIARCYDALAHAVGVIRQIDRLGEGAKGDDEQEAFEFGAEANSALRIALERTWLTSPDGDQDGFHRWIRRETSARAIYVPRFMKLDDPADPHSVDDLARRLGTLNDRVERHADRVKQIKERFNKLKYHLRSLHAGHDDVPGDHNRVKIAEAIETLAGLGVPVSDRRFRRLIGEHTAESFLSHHACSPAVQRVLESVRAWHAAPAGVQADIDGPADERWSDRVREVRSLLAGGVVVMIGGQPRNDAIDRIKDAFDLEVLTWVRLAEHGTGQPMRAPIYRPETRLVLVLVKLTGHLQVEEAGTHAKAADKPLVMLKAGYNPEQIAEAVLQQASEQLRESALSPDV